MSNGKLWMFTGVPGAGKTALLVDALIEHAKDRPIYVANTWDIAPKSTGLKGLTLAHTVIDGDRWHELVPDGAVFVCDEAQKVWRPRGPSQKPPPSVEALETHRHRGIDILITTQRPALLDANVRGLAGRHVHVRDTGWLGRWLYEWPECSDSLAWKTCAVKRKVKLPKRVFEVYKSAEVHTEKIKGFRPPALVAYCIFAAVVVLGALVWRSVGSKGSAVPVPAAASAPGSGGLMVRHGSGVAPGPITAASLRASFQPRLTNAPETAPAYDELRQVVRMRRVVGGFCRDGLGCRCFDQDGLDPGLSQVQCFKWVKSPPFDPYRIPVAAQSDDRERFGVGPRGGIGGAAPDAKPSSSLTRASGGL